MTFEEVKNEYLMRIGQSSSVGGTLEDNNDHIRRIRKAYNDICRDTMATWREPQLVSLAAVTTTTNQHDLASILSVTSLYDVHQVFWYPGYRMARWNKQVIDEMNINGTPSGDPIAFCTWRERSTDENSAAIDKWYIGFYPYVASANTTDCRISFFEKPTVPTVATWSTTYPNFADDYHECIAEKAALGYLRDHGDPRYTRQRWVDVHDEIQKMKDLYTPMVIRGESRAGFMQSGSAKTYRHGEEVND